MEIIQMIALFITISVALFAVAYLDKKYQLNLSHYGAMLDDMFGIDESLGQGSVSKETLEKELAKKDDVITNLTERVQTLERIVTDPAEQLKRDIDRL